MKNKRGLVLLIISAGFLALVITAGVWNKRTNATGMAASYEELLLVMQTDFEDYNIHIWKNEENAYYFLLPAAVDLNSVCFGNVGKNTQLFLDGEEVDGNTDLAALISYGDPCVLQMTVEQVQLEPVEVVFFHSEKINRHSPYLSITLHKCYPYYLFGISTFPNLAYHSIALRKFSITIV